MPKTVHITSVHPIDDNRIRFKECRGLSRDGYDVVLVGANGKSSEGDDGVSVHVVNKPTSRIKRMLVTTLSVCRKALKEKGDIYHFHDPELLPFVQLLRLFGKRVVFDMHESVPKAILDKGWIAKPLRRPISFLTRLMERICLFRVPVVFAEASYREEYGYVKRFAVVQNFPDISTISEIDEPKHEVFSLGYMGGLSDIRGASVMLRTFEVLRAEGHQIELHCIGRGELAPGRKDPLPDGIKLYGFLPAEEGFGIISRCHVGLAVLMPIPNYVRSYPTKMFEYMALGLPIVVSDFPLYREALGESDCGYLVDPTDSDRVIDAVRNLITDPEKAVAMGVRGKERVMEHYSWANELRHLTDLYEELLAL